MIGFINFEKNILIMQTANFNGFIKMIFWLIIFYYVVKFLAKLFLPVMIKKVVKKAEENFKQQQGYNNPNPINKDVSDKTQNDKPRETKKVGEYVDFEEID